MRRRRLSDLYVRGTEVTVDDGAEEPVTVWLQKINGVDRESCLRRSHAAKARYLLDADHEDSETFQAIYSQIRGITDREVLIGLIVSEDLSRYGQRVEAEKTADEEGWGKDGYVQGLVDAWVGDDESPGLAAMKLEDPDDPEVQRVDAELQRFEKEVRDEVDDYHKRLLADWVDASEDKIWIEATKRMITIRSREVLTKEFDRQQVFFSVRDPDDHSRRYFGTLTEVDDLDPTIFERLLTAYNKLMVDPIEGKGSRASQPSSISSDPSPAEETPSDSGLQAVSA